MTSSERTNFKQSVVLLHAYLDGELSVSESVEAERAIAADGKLAAQAAAVRALKHALQTRLPVEALPADFTARVAQRVGHLDAACRVRRACDGPFERGDVARAARRR